MTRAQAVAGGLLAGAVAAALILVGVSVWGGGGDVAPGSAPGDAASPPVHERSGAEPPPGALRLRRLPVTLYLRGGTSQMSLVPVTAEIVWLGSVEERARAIVQRLLEGTGAREDAFPPAAPGVACREVYLHDGTLWVDLDGSTLGGLAGADEEISLVAALTMTLATGLEDVSRVGILVDGAPRRTLAGHVDISRPFTAADWAWCVSEGGDAAGAIEL